jgi:ABC-2 type transport system ATP-binding protein
MIVARFTAVVEHTGTVVIETADLSRSFGQEVALDGLTIEAGEGEVVALLGPNGAGKTTTVRLLNGILRPDRGASRVLGLDPAVAGEELRRHTGVLTETAALDDRLTARENLVAYARIRGFGRADAVRRADELLGRFGLAARAGTQVQGFSTGQRKRVALARALLHDPQVLFLDEPTSGLDPAATREVIDLIASLATEHGRTVLLCTHFLGEAGQLAGRMAVLDRGRLRAFGTVEELAARMWEGLEADVDLGGAADERLLGVVRGVRGVLEATATVVGVRVRVAERDVLPVLVGALVAHEAPVFAAIPRPPSLEDVYFAIQERVGQDQVAP